MRRHSLRRTLDWQGVEQLEPRQLLFAISWDGGGGDFSWHNPLNWYGDVLPGPDDDVFINDPAAITIFHSENVQTRVRSISSQEAVQVSGGTISVQLFWRQWAPLTLEGGGIEGEGNIVLAAGGVWSGGSMLGSGRTQLTAGEFRITGDVVLGRELVNNASLVWEAGDIAAHGARIHNQAARTFVIQSGGTLRAVSGESWIFNAGTLALEVQPEVITTIEIGLHNHARRVAHPIIIFSWMGSSQLRPGTVEVRSGQLVFTGTVLQKQGSTLRGGNWKVLSSDGKLILPGPIITEVHSLPGEATVIELAGAGSAFPQLLGAATVPVLVLRDRAFPIAVDTYISHLTIDNAGVTTIPVSLLTDVTQVLRGHVVVGNYGSTNTMISEGAQLSITGRMELRQPGSFFWTLGPEISGDGTLRLTGTLDMSAGRISVRNFLIGPTGRLELSGDIGESAGRWINSRLVNYGTIEWLGFNTTAFGSEVVNRGTFNVRGQGFVNTSAGLYGSAPVTFYNFGMVNVVEGGRLTFRGAGGGTKFINHGSVNVQQGILNLFGGTAGGGAWSVGAGSELAIGGLAGSLSGAQVHSAGMLRIGNQLVWTNGSVSGGGSMVIGPTGNLILLGENSFGRSQTTNNGVLNVREGAVANWTGTLTNNGVIILGGLLNAETVVLNSTSVLRVGVFGPGPVWSGSIMAGRITMGGMLIGDFAWAAPVGTMVRFITATQSQQGAFNVLDATGLPGGRTVEVFNIPTFLTPFGAQLRVIAV